MDAKIRPHRESVDQLGEIRSVLRRLDAVFTLPSKIRIALDRGSVHVAAASYARVRPVLDSLGHQGGLRAVVAECKPLVERMKGMLRERLVQGDDQALSLLQVRGRGTIRRALLYRWVASSL